MYNNKYYLEMRIPNRLSSEFNNIEIQMLEKAKSRHNYYFVNATSKQTRNRKYISRIITRGDIIGFYLETEYPIVDEDRIGNALRMYSIIAATNGLGGYVSNQRLMKAALFKP